MPLEDIPVVVAGEGPVHAFALLREITALLRQLIETGRGGAIDLRSLPLSTADLAWLRERLGGGEVRIDIQAGGPTTCTETGVPGVWWVEHRDGRGRPTAEFIEVARIPEIALTHPDDLQRGLDCLNERIHGQSRQ